MSAKPSVAIIILNYNGMEHLDECLRSIEAMTYPRESLRIIVADNGSTDGSLEHCAEHYPWAEIDAHNENLGFSAGNNRSAAKVDTDYVGFLNNDVRVDPGWLEPLIEALESSEDVICAGSHVLDFPGDRVLYAGGEMHFSGFGYQKGMGAPLDRFPTTGPPQETLFATGCAFVARREAYNRITGFDEDFFAYYEDVELGWRWWVLGYRVLYVPQSVIYHKGDASFQHAPSDRKQFMWNRNVLCAIFKNYEEEHLARILPVAILLTLERAMFFLDVSGLEPTARVLAHFPGLPVDEAHERRIEVGIAHLEAVQGFVDLLPLMTAKRDRIQKERKRSDAEILAKFPFELDYRDQVNEARTRSALCRLLPMLDVTGLWDAKRLDDPLLEQMRKLESAVESYQANVGDLHAELDRRGAAIEDWMGQTRDLNQEVARLLPLEAELAGIKSKSWYKAVMKLRGLRAKIGGKKA